MRTYLVTGGLGFIGSNLVRALLKAGNKVRVLDNSSRGSVSRISDLEKGLEIIAGDIREPEIVKSAVKGVDSVCHLAFVNGTQYFYEKPELVLEVGVKGITNILDSCISSGISELILASSSEVYQTPSYVPTDEKIPLSVPDPLNPRYSYGGSKIISELMAINYGRKFFRRVIIFRPHNVFGPDMGNEHVIPQLTRRMLELKENSEGKKIEFPIQGTGRESRAFVYIEDFVNGLLLVMEKGEHLNIYNIGTDEELLIKDVAYKIARCLKIDISIITGPEAPGSTKRRCPDISKLRSLGFAPKIKFEDALGLTVDWYARQFKQRVAL
jgi:nucleoside-diphosphate-sugar epimerase